MTKNPIMRITANKLAKRWGISHKTVITWEKNGTLPKRQELGTIKFWPENQIISIEKERTVTPGGAQ